MTTGRKTPEGRPWIRPLPERLINKIAAGEVVERPASVVKELVENSLDAGADQVQIEVENSGVRLIKIVDNGCGIGPDQIEIAFSRHATSKISDFKDLDRILSYGFRGEALPSIASVSRLRMVSRPAGEDTGTEIIFEGGVLQSKRPIAAPPGTTIEVENLFFNTPARRKFLKAESTEARHVSRVSTALAIGRYDRGFSYRINKRKVFSLPPGQSLGERVAALLSPGKEFIEVRGQHGPVVVEGFLGMPDMAMSNRNGQYIFINGRLIQSPSLSHALVAGYGEMMPRGNFPIGALLLTIDPEEIDVNVHPAKTEVRLSQERQVHDSLYRLVKDTLRERGVIPTLPLGGPGGVQQHPQAAGSQQLRFTPPDAHTDRPSYRIPGVGQSSGGTAEMYAELYRQAGRANPSLDGGAPGDVVRVDTATGEIVSESPPSPDIAQSPGMSTDGLSLVGRFGDLYLLFQSGNDMLVIDQHTAHERVLYEENLKRMDDQGGVAQQLLLPVQVELSPEQYALFEESEAQLTHAGFGVAGFGGTTVRVEAVPSVLTRRSPEKALRSMLDDIGDLRKTGYDLKKAIAQSLACRAAVMAGDRLTDREAIGLVSSLLKCENAYSCPHGRPTFIKISKEDLDRQFGRG